MANAYQLQHLVARETERATSEQLQRHGLTQEDFQALVTSFRESDKVQRTLHNCQQKQLALLGTLGLM
jgi:hypothetical protein